MFMLMICVDGEDNGDDDDDDDVMMSSSQVSFQVSSKPCCQQDWTPDGGHLEDHVMCSLLDVTRC